MCQEWEGFGFSPRNSCQYSNTKCCQNWMCSCISDNSEVLNVTLNDWTRMGVVALFGISLSINTGVLFCFLWNYISVHSESFRKAFKKLKSKTKSLNLSHIIVNPGFLFLNLKVGTVKNLPREVMVDHRWLVATIPLLTSPRLTATSSERWQVSHWQNNRHNKPKPERSPNPNLFQRN